MKSFINLKTGAIETPNNSMVIEQYEKYTEIYKEVSAENSIKNAENSVELTYNELKKKAKKMGIKYQNNITKAELLKLINEQ